MMIQDLNQDANNVSESYLQISVEFSDSESTCESGPASFVEQEARFNQNPRRKESFLTELEVKTRTEFLLQIGNEVLEKEHVVEPEMSIRPEINTDEKSPQPTGAGALFTKQLMPTLRILRYCPTFITCFSIN